MLNTQTKVNILELTQDKDRIAKSSIKSSYIHTWKTPFESHYADNVQDFDRIVELLTSDKFKATEYLEEYSWLICMKTHGELIGIYELGHGGLTSCMMDPREVFMKSILVGAVRIALVHNHPSGDPTPSKADMELTENIRLLSETAGIYLYDHIIIAMNGNFSILFPTEEEYTKGAHKIIHKDISQNRESQ